MKMLFDPVQNMQELLAPDDYIHYICPAVALASGVGCALDAGNAPHNLPDDAQHTSGSC